MTTAAAIRTTASARRSHGPVTTAKPRPHPGAGIPRQPYPAVRSAGPSFLPSCQKKRSGGAVTYGSYVDEVALVAQFGAVVAGQLPAISQRYYLLSNHLYSPAAAVSDAGGVVERYRYDAYGKRSVYAPNLTALGGTGISNAIVFTGRYLDSETGLVYFRARQYSTAQGRFIGRDPWPSKNDQPFRVKPRIGIGYINGVSSYQSYFIPNRLDPYGLFASESDCLETFNMLLSSNEEIAEKYHALQSGGCNLQYRCICCDPKSSQRGSTDGWSDSTVTISACWNLITNDFVLGRIIIHELEHAITRCGNNKPNKVNCSSTICEEIRAIKRDRLCEFNENGTPTDPARVRNCVILRVYRSIPEECQDHEMINALYDACN